MASARRLWMKDAIDGHRLADARSEEEIVEAVARALWDFDGEFVNFLPGQHVAFPDEWPLHSPDTVTRSSYLRQARFMIHLCGLAALMARLRAAEELIAADADYTSTRAAVQVAMGGTEPYPDEVEAVIAASQRYEAAWSAYRALHGDEDDRS